MVKVRSVDSKSILTKSNLPIADYSVNPYTGCTHGCRYCYARFMLRFTGHTEPWGEFLDVKNWKPIKNKKKYVGSSMVVGSVTDPYNSFEEKFRRTRRFLEEMSCIDVDLTIITKSDLVLRDIDLLKKFDEPIVAISVNTLDENFRSDMDKAVPIARRIKALKRLHEEGIRTALFISPIFPGITDIFAIIERVSDFVDYIWLEDLNLRGAYRKDIMDYIKKKYPDKYPLYESIYNKKDRTYWIDLAREVEEYAKKRDYVYVVDEDSKDVFSGGKIVIINYFYHSEIKKSAKSASSKENIERK